MFVVFVMTDGYVGCFFIELNSQPEDKEQDIRREICVQVQQQNMGTGLGQCNSS
jgi:hypothetical protein